MLLFININIFKHIWPKINTLYQFTAILNKKNWVTIANFSPSDFDCLSPENKALTAYDRPGKSFSRSADSKSSFRIVLGLRMPTQRTSKVSNRLATRGSTLLSVIGIKTTPNYAILRCFLATGTLYLLPKSLRPKYIGLTRQCQGSVRAHS